LVAQVVVFHSVYGLRQVELTAAERLRAAGHDLVIPDQYGGQTADSPGAGLSLKAAIGWMAAIGWEVICRRARQALSVVPGQAVLAGFSVGACVIGSLWEQRRQAAGMCCCMASRPSRPASGPGCRSRSTSPKPIPSHPRWRLPSGTPPPSELAWWRRCSPIPAPGTSTPTTSARADRSGPREVGPNPVVIDIHSRQQQVTSRPLPLLRHRCRRRARRWG
jgi:hypothetical protein